MKKPFYTDGLKFSCKRCSSCCRHSPGYVFISYNDLENLSRILSLTKLEFTKKYCRIINIGGFQRVSLTEKANYDCIFWETDKGCAVYEYRPLQCRSFPFWSSHIESPETWNELAGSCPGINTGKLFSKTEIEIWLEKKLKEGFIKIKNGKILVDPENDESGK